MNNLVIGLKTFKLFIPNKTYKATSHFEEKII